MAGRLHLDRPPPTARLSLHSWRGMERRAGRPADHSAVSSQAARGLRDCLPGQRPEAAQAGSATCSAQSLTMLALRILYTNPPQLLLSALLARKPAGCSWHRPLRRACCSMKAAMSNRGERSYSFAAPPVQAGSMHTLLTSHAMMHCVGAQAGSLHPRPHICQARKPAVRPPLHLRCRCAAARQAFTRTWQTPPPVGSLPAAAACSLSCAAPRRSRRSSPA